METDVGATDHGTRDIEGTTKMNNPEQKEFEIEIAVRGTIYLRLAASSAEEAEYEARAMIETGDFTKNNIEDIELVDFTSIIED